MADEQALIMKEALEGFDTPHLQKLIVVAYDRWNWDTGTDTDKAWFTIAEEILAERGISTVSNSNNTNITFNMGSNGPTVPVLSMDQAGELILGTKLALKLKNTDSPGVEHELFDANQNGTLTLGWDLKKALLDFMAQELISNSTTNSNGQNLGQIFEDKITMTVRNRM